MSPSSRSATRPPLARLAEMLHQGCRELPGSVLLTVRQEQPPSPSLDIGCWPVPRSVGHPADPLIGFLAQPSWCAVGLSSRGLLHQTEPELSASSGPAGPAPCAVRATVLRNRLGGAATVLETEGGGVRLLHDVPEGWVSDALARALGLATPAPTVSVASVVEATWLDRLADLVLTRPGGPWSWAELARLHPLAPRYGSLPGAALAARSRALEGQTSWPRARRAVRELPVAARTARPPGGQPVAPHRWFDDGSFSRWVERNLPPTGPLLDAVVQGLPSALAAELRAALITVEPADPVPSSPAAGAGGSPPPAGDR